jgi:sigma-B regulation protein RsbU (phosphoserine phosphatase)
MSSGGAERAGSATAARRGLLVALAVAYALASLAYAGIWMYYLDREPGARLGFVWAPAEEGGVRVARVLPGGVAERAGLRAGDRITAVDGQGLASLRPYLEMLAGRAPGDAVRLEVERSGGRLLLDAVFPGSDEEVTVNPFTRLTRGLLSVYPVLFLAVGLPVLFLRVTDRHAWLLALLFGGFAASAPYFEREAVVDVHLRGFAAAYKVALNGLTPAIFYWFFATFPAPSPHETRRPWLKKALLAAAGAVCLPLAALCLAAGGSEPLHLYSGLLLSPATRPFLYLYSFGAFGLGLASLVTNARRGRDGETRRKARVMLWGTVAGLTPILVLNLVGILASLPLYAFPFWAWAPCVLALLLWPLSFAYAVVKHRVLEIPLLLRRSARYLLVQRGALGLGILVVVLDSLLVVWALSRLPVAREWALPLGVGGGIAFGLGLGFSALHVQRRVRERIDRSFFRQAYDARRILEDLAQRVRLVNGREELAGLLDRHLREALQPSWLVVYLARERGVLEAVGADEAPLLPTLSASARFLAQARAGKPFLVENAGAAELGPLGGLGPECLVPLLGRDSSLLGLLALGPRLSEEPYSSEDKTLLGAAASQASLALESVVMAEEMASRQRVEQRAARELEIARDVQRKLLPQKRPALSTLEYAADCVQARAVGGDYWDVVDLGPGRVAFVLADISGKGISAALLMANLQASLRSRPPEAFQDLPGLVLALNRHLNESTETSRYATLFLGVYEDASRLLRYANCGHGPPFVLREDGRIERLLPTAPVIGLFEGWEAATAELALGPGDWLVLFTDGVTDARGSDDREFGEERLVAAVAEGRAALPGEVLRSVLVSVASWGGGNEQWDDQTLVLARGR